MNCTHCQTLNPDQAKFCMNCGERLVPSGSVEAGKAKASDFNLDRYLPQELVTKLESARARNSMVGERRVITMLFCDVKGSTAAAVKVDPEVWTDIMNGVFEFMIRPLHKYEDLCRASWGLPFLHFLARPLHMRTIRSGPCWRRWKSRRLPSLTQRKFAFSMGLSLVCGSES